MIPLRLGEIGTATLVLGDPEPTITSVAADSRLARPGTVFVCLRGSRRDGHGYALDAAALGIVLLVAVGPGARAYLDGGAGRIRCCWLPDLAAARWELPALLQPGEAVLLKGSRSARLELLAEELAR
ncbi:Mur ligase family, catalytic domain [Gaiella occulta]|uniref:Mur ligase family, catalytic domain n=1 Tax=Gaiella occulta TaxID=1002870 RepID=A0A7M2YWT8_9ACTN|nr:Mur ligase domain-containing protein [Gaiella occulta]RDI73918.1 Mur ligase family, catalytic domain [Gaiella occulta]